MKIINKEFDVELQEYAQTSSGGFVLKNHSKKNTLSSLILPTLKLIPQDKGTDLDYLIRANELRKKLESAKAFDEIEFSESEFSLFKTVGENVSIGALCDGLIEFKKYMRDIKFEKPE